MRYTDSIASSAQALRQALPLMSRQRAALHPVSYAIWYEHVTGMNGPLSRELQQRTQDGHSLDEAQTWELYRKHVAELDGDSALHLTHSLGGTLEGVSDSTEQASERVQHYAQSLQRWGRALQEAAPGQHTQVLATALQGTQDMQGAIQALLRRIELSRQEVTSLREQVQRARSEALLDPLTGLASRRGFEQALQQCLHSPEAGTPVAPCLVLGDIDEFQRLQQGLTPPRLDETLQQVANTLRSVAQSHHIVARLEEDEFALLLPSAGLHEAMMLAEQLSHGVAQLSPGQDKGRLSLSVGVTQMGQGERAADFLARADQALRHSRQQGRSRVTVLAADAQLVA